MGFGKFLQCKELSSSFAQREAAGDSEEIVANTVTACQRKSRMKTVRALGVVVMKL